MIKTLLIFLSTFHFWCWNANSQSWEIEGIVLDAATNQPLPYVSVYLKNQCVGDASDINGHFKLSSSCEDILIVSYIGYQTVEIAVSEKESKQLKIDLHFATKALEEIEINAKRNLLDNAFNEISSSKFELDKEAILTLPSLTGEPDYLKSLMMLPGATKGVEGSSDIFVRGGDADQNMVLFNGATMYNTGHLFGFLSVFNPYATSSAVMMTGGFPAEYGGRLSSIIDVKSKKANFADFVIEGSIGTLASNLSAEAPLISDKLSVTVSGRRTYADQAVRLIDQSLPYFFYDLNGQLDFRIDNSLNLQYHFFKGVDDLAFRKQIRDDMISGTDFLIENNTHTFLIQKQYASRLKSTTNLHYTQFRYRIHSFFQENQLNVNSDINDFGFEHQFVFVANDHHEITSGIKGISHEVMPNFIDSQGEIAEFVPSGKGRTRNMLESSIFTSWKFRKDQLSTLVGLRLSSAYQEEAFYINPEPRLSLRWQLKEDAAFKLSYSRMFQYMNRISSSSYALPTDIWYPVTSYIKPQHSDQVSAGYQHKLNQPKILASIDIYYKKMVNQIAFREATDLTFNNEFEDALLQGRGSSYGAEVLIRRDVGQVRGWLAYTLSWSNRQFDELNNGEPFRARYDRRHNLSLVVNYAPHPRWTFSAVWEYISGARFTPVIGYYAVPNAAMAGADLIPVFPNRNSVGLNDSHRLDLSVSLHGRYRPGKKWYSEWQLSAYNVYNRTAPIAISLAYDAEQNRYFYEQPGLFGFLPSLTYRFTYSI